MSHVALILSAEALASAFDEPVFRRLRTEAEELIVVSPSHQWPQHLEALRRVDAIFSGWGAPRMDEAFLRELPNLRVIFYAGGSVRYFITDALWARGVRVTTAQAINAIPVAEYSVSAILLGLKRFWHYARVTRETRDFPIDRPMPGAYGSTVGLISYGTIAKLVRQRLRSFDLDVIVYDPFLEEADAKREGMRKVGLEELFATADVVSLHTPHLADTVGMIQGRHLARMKPGALFLNTARGEIVDEAEMIEVLQERSDLQAVLDVSSPEPPLKDSALYTLPNVVLTPHIAGSVGAECQRMGHAMVDEFIRFRNGKPLRWEITAEDAKYLA